MTNYTDYERLHYVLKGLSLAADALDTIGKNEVCSSIRWEIGQQVVGYRQAIQDFCQLVDAYNKKLEEKNDDTSR